MLHYFCYWVHCHRPTYHGQSILAFNCFQNTEIHSTLIKFNFNIIDFFKKSSRSWKNWISLYICCSNRVGGGDLITFLKAFLMSILWLISCFHNKLQKRNWCRIEKVLYLYPYLIIWHSFNRKLQIKILYVQSAISIVRRLTRATVAHEPFKSVSHLENCNYTWKLEVWLYFVSMYWVLKKHIY